MRCKKCGSGQPSLFTVPLAYGVREDCERLLYQLAIEPALDFEKFCTLWQKSQFCYVLFGRPTLHQTCELAEETLHIIKSYVVRPRASYTDRVCALFLLYAVASTQPIANNCKIRITPSDIAYLKLIEEEARRLKQHEVLYVLGSVLAGDLVYLTSTAIEHGLDKKTLSNLSTEKAERARLDGDCVLDQSEASIKMREVVNVFSDYAKHKKNICGERPDRNLSFVNEKFGEEMYKSLVELAIDPKLFAPPKRVAPLCAGCSTVQRQTTLPSE